MRCIRGIHAVWMALVVNVVSVADDPSDIRGKLETALPHLSVVAVSPSALSGFYEVEISGQSSVLHVDGHVSHIFAGDLYSITEDGVVNLSEARREGRRRGLFENLDHETTIVFPARGDTNAVINVFTDVTCLFCREFHQEVDELNGYGIEVRYLGYPRDGPDSATHGVMASAWCSDNRQLAITQLKNGDTIPARTCEDPIRLHWELGRAVGVEGTPTLITESGMKISGHMSAGDLARKLGLAEAWGDRSVRP